MKLDIKNYILYESIYMNCPEETNLQKQKWKVALVAFKNSVPLYFIPEKPINCFPGSL